MAVFYRAIWEGAKELFSRGKSRKASKKLRKQNRQQRSANIARLRKRAKRIDAQNADLRGALRRLDRPIFAGQGPINTNPARFQKFLKRRRRA